MSWGYSKYRQIKVFKVWTMSLIKFMVAKKFKTSWIYKRRCDGVNMSFSVRDRIEKQSMEKKYAELPNPIGSDEEL